MAFSGSLEDMSSGDVMELLSDQGKTGLLSFVQEPDHANIYLSEGNIQSLSVTMFDIARPLRFRKKPTKKAYFKAIEIVQILVQDAVAEVAGWRDGRYLFSTNNVTPPEYYLPQPLSMMALLFEGFRLLDEWENRSLAPIPMDSLVVVLQKPSPIAEFSPVELEIIGQLKKGYVEVADLIEKLERSRFEIFPAIYELRDKSLVKVTPNMNADSHSRQIEPFTPPSLVQALTSDGSEEQRGDNNQLDSQAMSEPVPLKEGTESQIRTLNNIAFRLEQQVGKQSIFDEKTKGALFFAIQQCIDLRKYEYLDRFISVYLDTLQVPEEQIQIQAIDILVRMMKMFLTRYKEGAERLIQHFRNAIIQEKNLKKFQQYKKTLTDIMMALFESGETERAKSILNSFTHIVSKRCALPPSHKRIALEILKEFGDDTIIPTISEMAENPQYTNSVIDTLTGMDSQQGLSELLKLLTTSKDKKVRLKILETLPRYGKELSNELKTFLSREEWFIKRNMCIIIGNVGNPDLADSLRHLFVDEHSEVRKEAYEAYVKCVGKESEQMLLEAIPIEKDIEVRLKLIRMLPEFGTEQSTRRFNLLLRSDLYKGRDGEDPELTEICKTLGKIGGEFAIKALVRIIQNEDLQKTPDKAAVLNAAVHALGKIGDPQIIPALRSLIFGKHKGVSKTASRVAKRLMKKKGSEDNSFKNSEPEPSERKFL